MKYLCILFFLTSCSIYGNKFACPPSKGAYCKSLHEVDEMITTGEIERLDIDVKKQKKICK